MRSEDADPRASIEELCEIKRQYVDPLAKWYRTHTTWPRVVFRLAGTSVIVLSLAIPFLASAGDVYQKIGVPIASFIIALVSALNAFYSWQKTWEKRVSAQLVLEGLSAIWETEIAAAKRATDSKEAYKKAFEATQDLIEKAKMLSVAETNAFFATVKFPQLSEPKK
ncbi:MAG: hypothetical protein A4E65_03740 [Syntrophorhabdus sp. PtaU1.Bin153]|nr:MAG: hypothetical protein A4E65_03740 [Syntrophorhabdus sp. PtaU1.Bin153]